MAHIPVLLDSVLKAINPKEGSVILDCTFGAGGYSKAFLELGCVVHAVDRDPSVVKYADILKAKWPEQFFFSNVDFAQISQLFESNMFDGICFDLGVSSMQLDEKERGFSFMAEAPLDMRMDQSQELTATHLVNSMPEKELADIIYIYGDERKSRQIAAAIVRARKEKRIDSTLELARIIERAVGKYNDMIHPATRTFQALRIVVNNEFEQIELGLVAASKLLKPLGVLVVVTFHSGEDKIAKKIFTNLVGKKVAVNRYAPIEAHSNTSPKFENVFKGALLPSYEEIKANIRSRSAKIRAIRKISS